MGACRSTAAAGRQDKLTAEARRAIVRSGTLKTAPRTGDMVIGYLRRAETPIQQRSRRIKDANPRLSRPVDAARARHSAHHHRFSLSAARQRQAARHAARGLQLFSLIGVAGILELVGGILILIGLWTRPTAFILSGEMAFAYFIAHAGSNFLPLLNGGELAVIYCFVFLYFAFAGAGAFSIDHARKGAGS